MKNQKFKQLDNQKTHPGFTLIELILVMAIVGVLAAAVIVGIGSQRERAQETKVLAELSGTIQSIALCRSDGGEISEPATAGGNLICSIDGSFNNNYGMWPKMPDGFSYTSSIINSNAYVFSAGKGAGEAGICCISGGPFNPQCKKKNVMNQTGEISFLSECIDLFNN